MNPAAPDTMIRKQISYVLGSCLQFSERMVHSEQIDVTQPSTPEILIFLLLLAASVYAFWRRFGPIVRTIRGSQPDTDFQLQPVSGRVRQFVWEVLLQSKVIRERPIPGLAHAFVFWGFIAFAGITVAHLAAGAGLNLLPSDYAIVA